MGFLRTPDKAAIDQAKADKESGYLDTPALKDAQLDVSLTLPMRGCRKVAGRLPEGCRKVAHARLPEGCRKVPERFPETFRKGCRKVSVTFAGRFRRATLGPLWFYVTCHLGRQLPVGPFSLGGPLALGRRLAWSDRG